MEYLTEFSQITGKQVPNEIREIINSPAHKKKAGKDLVNSFSEILDDNGLEFRSLKLEVDLKKMTAISDWINDGYYDEDFTYIPLYNIKGKTTNCVALKVNEPGGNVYFFDKDTGFVSLDVNWEGFLAE